MVRFWKALLLSVVVSLLCAGVAFAQAPTITSFTPGIGGPGTSVNVTGTNFSSVQAIAIGAAYAASYTVNRQRTGHLVVSV